jgi:hypothetical protein
MLLAQHFMRRSLTRRSET